MQKDFSFIERYLYSRPMARDPDSCWDYLDLDSFVDYYILQEFLAVSDSFSASTYFYKDVRGKLHIGPVWDYNNVLNNFFHDLPETGYFLAQKGWFSQLMKSPRFVEKVISRYHELREGVLSYEYIRQYTCDVIDWLGSAIDRNYEVWGYSFDPALLSSYERRSPTSHSDETETIETMNPHSFEEADETEKYGEQHLIGFSNSPQTDFLRYEENYARQLIIDAEHVIPQERLQSGYFAAYHLYDYCDRFSDFLDATQKQSLSPLLQDLNPAAI